MRLLYLIIGGIFLQTCRSADDGNDSDGDVSRKILGSSVVTSVSVVMDTGNKKSTIYTDAVGKPQSKPSNPSELASPIDLLNPDRYEFYTFDDNGDLVKRLMSLDEIKSIIARGDSDDLDLDSFTAQGFLPERRVNDVVSNVQSVLKEEMEILKDPVTKPIFDTPDVSDSWSMILPAVFGNSGEDIKPEKPIGYVTPDTIMLEPNSQITHSTHGPQKVDIILSSIATTKRPPSSPSTKIPSSSSTSTVSSTHISQPVYYSSSALPITKQPSSTTEPTLNVEIISNGISTTNNHPSKESPTEVQPNQEDDEVVPTRVSTLSSTRPPLIRNITKATDRPLTSTPKPSLTTSLLPSSIGTTTQKLSSTSHEVPISQSTSLKPTSTKWTSTSFRPISTQFSELPTSTLKYVSTFPVPNIFGLPSVVDISTSTYQTARPINTPKPTRSPPPNIFGFPAFIEQKNKPTVTTREPPTSPKPIKSTTRTSTASQIDVKPQLGATSTVSNQYSSSLVTSPTSEKTKITTERNIEELILSSTNKAHTDSDIIIKQNAKYNLTSTESDSDIKSSTWAPSPEDAQLFNIFKEVLSQSTTEVSKNISSPPATNTEYLISDTTNINDVLSFESNKIQTTEQSSDLSTLPTERIQQKIPTTTDFDGEDVTTKLPSILNALNDKQKLSASELLDQLLITTNIYEINTELADSKLNVSDVDVRFENTEKSSVLPVEDSTQQMTTTDHDFISYPPTTDATLIESIEQLLSQAVGDVQVILNQTTERTQNILQGSSSDTITSFTREAGMQSADITTSSTEPEAISTTVNNLSNDAITSSNNDNLSSSVEALLSQVNDHTTLNKIIFTEKPNTEVTYRRVEETGATISAKPTTLNPVTVSIDSSSSNSIKQQEQNFETTENPKTDTEEKEGETTTIYYVLKKDPNISTTEGVASHLINITVFSFDPIKNRTKPAKADLSLEQELIKEEMKNITLLQNEISNTIANSTKSTQVNSQTDKILSVRESTTPQAALNIDTTILEQDEITEEMLTSTSQADTTTNDVRFAEDITTEIPTTTNSSNFVPIQSSTIQYAQISTVPRPSIVITINENNTLVTENGKLVANKTISTPQPLTSTSNKVVTVSPTKLQKNSTQDQTWTLVSTVAPQHPAGQNIPPPTIPYPEVIDPPAPVDLVPKPMQGFGLEESTANLEVDVHQFAQLCNELAFGFWKTVTAGLSSARSLFVSPFAATSMLAMVFLGAKGATSEEMNEILKLDDMVTFNPHLIFKSVSESVTSEPNSGVATTAIIRELFSDRSKGKLLDFYKNRVRAFYDGFAEEVSYREIGDVIRRRSNLLVKKYTNGKYAQFFNDASIVARSPLSGISINIFETDCSQTSSEGRDGELYFVVFPSMKQRRLIPIPAVVYRSGFLAGYEPSLDATAVALGGKDQVVSTILVIPGQQGIAAPGDGLARLEKRLVESSFKKGAWSRLLRSLIPRPGLEVQIPRFSHRSIINATNTLQRMGLHELFNPESADLRGLNGVANELHLSDVLQINKFATCGEKRTDESQHSEVYPATTKRARAARRLYHHITTLDQDEPRDYQRSFHDPLHNPSLLDLPLSLRPRQARIPEIPRLRFDRPFLYFVRHNPTGLILHMGRFNPRLLP